MKMTFALALLLAGAGFQASAQKYKTTADTVKLNQEWVTVNNDIAELTSKITVAQNNLPGYNTKAEKATSDAQSAAEKNTDQASKASGTDIGDAKAAKKKAKKALKEARNADNARDDVKDQEKKIDKMNGELQKKQKRLQELEEMRMAIRSMPQQQ